MRRAQAFAGRALSPIVLVLLAASPAAAAGVGLRWDACVADGGTINRSFACNTNTGALFLVSSFVLDQPLTNVRRVDVSLELASASPTLPAWWDLTGCRSGSRTASSVTTTLCSMLSGSPGISGFVLGEHGANTERMEIGIATFSVSISAGPEVEAVALRLEVSRTIGSDACSGCEVPACIVVRTMSFTRVPGQPPEVVLTQPLNGTDNFVTWQGSGTAGGSIGCPAATATRRSVWGAVKALYR